MTTLLLVRHGQSEANLKGIFAGNLDVKLMELGYMQAQKAAEYIKENYEVSGVYASDLKRASETGRTIAEHLGVDMIHESNLREIRAGEWEGKSFDILASTYANDYGIWLNDIGNCRCTGGESVKALGERVLKALERIARDNDEKTVVIATHATPIRAAECLISKENLNEMKNVPWSTNASVTVISYENGKFSVVNSSIDSYLADFKTSFPANV